MSKFNSSDHFISQANFILAACIVVAAFAALLMYLKKSTAPTTPFNMKENEARNVTESGRVADFSMWKPISPELKLPFEFLIPEQWSLQSSQGAASFNILDRATQKSIATISVFPFAELVAKQKALPASEFERFGWTNAYGASVFEHRDFKNPQDKKLTAFVVNTEKKEFAEVSVSGEKNVETVQKILKTVDPVKSDTDKGPRIFVDFDHDFLFKHLNSYTRVAPARPEIPTRPLNDWEIKNQKNEVVGLLTVRSFVSDDFSAEPAKLTAMNVLIQGQPQDTFQVIQHEKIGGVDTAIFQSENSDFWPLGFEQKPVERGMIFRKGDEYVVVRLGFADKQNLNAHAYEMSQLFQSVRFLTGQEKVQ